MPPSKAKSSYPIKRAASPGSSGGTMSRDYSVNLSVQQVLSLWVHGATLQHFTAAVAGVYRVAGKRMAPLEALVFGVGQTTLSVVISFSRILATL
uniref:Transmembrane protein 170B n=1 Tax=Fundulus heteroclitus TaxID=8078 RepID=A0A3Q2PIG6_FUNHE